MNDVPDFGTFAGESSLFDTGEITGHEVSTNDDGTHGCETFQRATEFISCNGSVVKLRRKAAGRPELSDPAHLGLEKSSWRDDETYGININALLDRIEAKNDGKRQMISTNGNNGKRRRGRLLVEKWRPKNFLDLVGNERTNRRVLRWLRQWSPCVFNEKLSNDLNKNHKDLTGNDPDNDRQFDPLQRPQKRILLIHGPPGIGKTSVTHVVAKQAGFCVAEINASDERAGIAVKDKVHNTLFNHTFNESAVCLVADEIDGSVESGFIKVLIDIVNNDSKATQKMILGSQVKMKKAGKKKSSRLLVRPIIAICNNLYAPALEKLKPHCEIISFKRPSDGSLQERLERICKVEDMKIPLGMLKELMDLSQGDVRNCINNLQFLSLNEKNAKLGSAEIVDSLESCTKDFSVSWFKICNQLFRKDPHSGLKSQLLDLSRQVELNGSSDRIVQGCHSLYPLKKYSDNGLTKPAALSDWLLFHDLMFKSLFEHNGELLRYSAVVPLVFYNFFSDIANKEDVRVKSSDFEFREQQKSNLDICKLLLHKISMESPSRMPFISQESFISEILPYVDSMLSSEVNKCKDLKVKQHMYDTMAEILRDFQLTLEPRYHEGMESRNLLGVEPPIENIVLLDLKRRREILTKRPAVYNVLLAKSEETKARKRHVDQAAREKEKNFKIRTKRAKLGASSVDFFKSQYGLDHQSKSEVQQTDADYKKSAHKRKEENVRIWVKFKEGFSDAVRKNVSWNDLWT